MRSLAEGAFCSAARRVLPTRSTAIKTSTSADTSRSRETWHPTPGSVLEVFVNDGYATMTSRLFGSSERTVVDAFDGAGSFCQMGSFVISEA